MNQSHSPHTTHDATPDSPQRTLGGAVLTAVLAPVGVTALAAPLLTVGAVLVVAAALVTPSVAMTVRERVRDDSGDSDSRRGQAAGGNGATADD